MANEKPTRDCPVCRDGIFSTLPEEELERLESQVHVLQRPRDNILYEEGDSAIEAYFICTGAVELFRRIERGGALILRMVRRQSIIGADDILANHREYQTSARALLDVRLVGIPREEFLRIAQNWPNFCYGVAAQLAGDLHTLRREHTMFVEKSLSKRLVLKLCELAVRYGTSEGRWMRIDLPLTNSELAELIGTTPGTVSMLLHDLKEQGTIERHGRQFLIAKSATEFSQVSPQGTRRG